MNFSFIVSPVVLALTAFNATPTEAADDGIPVTVGNFIRAETDFYFKTR